MTIDQAITRLQELKEEWGGEEQLFLVHPEFRKLHPKPIRHIDMCPPIGTVLVGYGYPENTYDYISDAFWD